MIASLRLVLATLVLAAFAGCAKNTAPAPAATDRHGHQAPHGGTLVELGQHAYNLEFVRDPAAGKLTVYVLSGHADSFVRIRLPSFAINAKSGGQSHPILLRAMANPATGETVGDTSQFEAEAEWLKNAAPFTATVPTIEIRGTTYVDVAVSVP